MRSLSQKVLKIYRSEGLHELSLRAMKYLYSHVRQYLPRRMVRYNGYYVPAGRLFDSLVPWEKVDRPKYESALVEGLRNCVEEGDEVTIIGGGWGVTAVVAAKQVGETGQVTVYEGARDCITNISNTLDANDVSDRVEVHHAIVGPEISLRGDKGGAKHVKPTELPECDILELDCEGSEIDILEKMNICPVTILVESHGMRDSPTEGVRRLLEELSYEIIDERIADEGLREQCLENDVRVIISERNE